MRTRSTIQTQEPPIENSDQPPRQKRSASLLRRVVTSIVGLSAYLFLVFVHSHWSGLPFALGIAALSVIGANEFYRAVRRQGAEPSDFLGLVACVVFQLEAWLRSGHRIPGFVDVDPILPAFLVLLVLVTLLVELTKRRHKPILNIGATLLGAIYVGWLLSFITLLHGIPNKALGHILVPPIAHTTVGQWLVILVSFCTMAGDIGALFTGNWLGRHKLAPEISPSKTWEGAVGGFSCSVLMAWGLSVWLSFPTVHAIALGIIIGVFGLLGDLCESALKRDLGVKDFGVILPGHGGVLDRIDSVLFTAPLAYYYISFFLLRHQ